jgi:phosphoribosyl 1,2-cyclic phosphodiesterase
MRIKFWGTRGSLPIALSATQVRQKVIAALIAAQGKTFADDNQIAAFVDDELPFSISGTYGGNSSCVQIITGSDEFVLCDCGSGMRPFGNHALVASQGKGRYHIFISHPHWDHLMGFPFFVPAYIPGNTITMYGCHARLVEAFAQQQHAPYFPVEFAALGATIDFVRLEPGKEYAIAGMTVVAKRQLHGGGSFGYRFSAGGRVLVYASDAEYKQEDLAEIDATVGFFRDADAVIFDAMYTLADSMSIKEDWGHSSNMVGVELCQMAGAKRLCMFHHEPTNDDQRLLTIQVETERLEQITRDGAPLPVITAYDGLELDLD